MSHFLPSPSQPSAPSVLGCVGQSPDGSFWSMGTHSLIHFPIAPQGSVAMSGGEESAPPFITPPPYGAAEVLKEAARVEKLKTQVSSLAATDSRFACSRCPFSRAVPPVGACLPTNSMGQAIVEHARQTLKTSLDAFRGGRDYWAGLVHVNHQECIFYCQQHWSSRLHSGYPLRFPEKRRKLLFDNSCFHPGSDRRWTCIRLWVASVV